MRRALTVPLLGTDGPGNDTSTVAPVRIASLAASMSSKVPLMMLTLLLLETSWGSLEGLRA